MDQQKIVETVGNLMGIVTALEVQTNALLLTSIGAGVDPNVILRAIEAVPKPHVPSLGSKAYEQAMAAFWRRLDEAAFEHFTAQDASRG